ncbi:hypothetical protein OIU85_002259 [Salix viminalis]|uniref:Uncharacterized protein n=1 Tax=Salix viminalis TaxID=40686 RepID=A0A9Q0VND6_SALVM|nr:hypothetical protein OIU85_002259 [Salix viminalis]
MERKGDGSGLGCSELSFGSAFTGSSPKLSDGTRFTGSPSRTGSLKDMRDSCPRVDVFVCTADPTIEPPIMVISTVLSAMAYDYPPEKLAIYLSDDAGSDLTFYALLEASIVCKTMDTILQEVQCAT